MRRLATRSFSHSLKCYNSEKKIIESICIEGTPLKGLDIFQNQPAVVAMADKEYPSWLWEITQEKSKEEVIEKGTRKEKRFENRKSIKEKNFLKSVS